MSQSVRSTVEPSPVELKRTETGEDSILLHLLIRWNITEETVPEPEPHTEYVYDEVKLTIPYTGARSRINNFLSQNESKLILQAKSKFEEEEDVDILTTKEKSQLEDLRQTILYATITEINATKPDKKYVQVEKTVEGQTLTTWCYVTYSVLLCNQNAELNIGDLVLIQFVDNDLDKPIVVDKAIY